MELRPSSCSLVVVSFEDEAADSDEAAEVGLRGGREGMETDTGGSTFASGCKSEMRAAMSADCAKGATLAPPPPPAGKACGQKIRNINRIYGFWS